jgi:hypothetical protein
MIEHIVMRNVRGEDSAARRRHIARLKAEFESLCGRVRGLLQLEVGVDESRVDHACDASRDPSERNRAAPSRRVFRGGHSPRTRRQRTCADSAMKAARNGIGIRDAAS